MYIFRASLRCVEWRAGSIFFDHCGGVGGGAVQVFRLWLCSGGYSTVEMVRGGGPFFSLLSSVCCQFSWRLGFCGRNFCVIYFRLVAFDISMRSLIVQVAGGFAGVSTLKRIKSLCLSE